jgi:competence protein ComEA
MTTSKLWTPLTILLLVIIAVASVIAWSRFSASRAAEISIADDFPAPEIPDEIYIGGVVVSPGCYPLAADDTIGTLVQAAGGVSAGGDGGMIELYVGAAGSEAAPQKINLNRAESWLLEALPGIGEERAKAIIDYRSEHGPFRSVSELTRVSGIGTKTLEQIEHLVTVASWY